MPPLMTKVSLIDLKDNKPVTIRILSGVMYIYKGDRLITRFAYDSMTMRQIIDGLEAHKMWK